MGLEICCRRNKWRITAKFSPESRIFLFRRDLAILGQGAQNLHIWAIIFVRLDMVKIQESAKNLANFVPARKNSTEESWKQGRNWPPKIRFFSTVIGVLSASQGLWMAPKWAPIKVSTVIFLILRSSDPIRGKNSHWGSKKAIIGQIFTKKPLFHLSNKQISLFLLPNHVGDSKMMEHEKIWQKYLHKACLDYIKNAQAAAL